MPLSPKSETRPALQPHVYLGSAQSISPHHPQGTTQERLPAMVPDRKASSSDMESKVPMTNAALTGLFPLAGIDYRVKTVTVDNAQVALQLWDTAGQER